jgi:L-ascorbate metabolism protein UlaG (beta-lactamase superfamily)
VRLVVGSGYTLFMSTLAITWLGHATCLFQSPGNTRLLADPWLATNPACPPQWHHPSPLDGVLISHGHSDHIEDAEGVARATGATVVSNFEICSWLGKKGVRNTKPMNKGGTVQVGDVQITMVNAEHSSSYDDQGTTVYLGEAAGFILRAPGAPTVYFAGDTGLFGDMRLIGDLYKPQLACLPIGDVFTMGPEQAARACEMLGVSQVLPIHHGTFPLLTGTPAALTALVDMTGVQVIDLKPGETAQ